MAEETEIKLAVDAQHARRLWGALAHYPHGKPASHRLFSAYYDTTDRRLQNAGVALRLRRVGQRWMQTIKSAGTAAGGLHRRAEFETAVPVQLPDLQAMIDAGIGKLVPAGQALEVAFTTDFRRSSAMLKHASGTIVEVSLDRGFIAAGERRDPICEIELELKEGEPDALFDLACEIARGLPVRLDNCSKAQRGYALAAGVRPAPVKASKPALRADMTIDEGFVAIVLHCLDHLQRNETGLLAGDDPEYLHQARVALRRLRSAFHIFGKAIPLAQFAPILEELKSVSQLLGAARDLDVFTFETLPRVGAARHSGLAALHRQAQAARQQAAGAAQAAIAAPDYTQALLRLVQALTTRQQRGAASGRAGSGTTLPKFAAKLISRRYARIMKCGRNISTQEFADLHALRIKIKRLRYAIEFFMPLFANEAADTLQALVDLQDLLGRLIDDVTAWQLLESFAVEESSPSRQQAVGFVRGWCAHDGQLCRGQLENAWKRLGNSQPRWN
jgi:triphosphatase